MRITHKVCSNAHKQNEKPTKPRVERTNFYPHFGHTATGIAIFRFFFSFSALALSCCVLGKLLENCVSHDNIDSSHHYTSFKNVGCVSAATCKCKLLRLNGEMWSEVYGHLVKIRWVFCAEVVIRWDVNGKNNNVSGTAESKWISGCGKLGETSYSQELVSHYPSDEHELTTECLSLCVIRNKDILEVISERGEFIHQAKCVPPFGI